MSVAFVVVYGGIEASKNEATQMRRGRAGVPTPSCTSEPRKGYGEA